MVRARSHAVWIGGLFWLAALLLGSGLLGSSRADRAGRGPHPLRQLLRFASGQGRQLDAVVAGGGLRTGTPVFASAAGATWKQVGFVTEVVPPAPASAPEGWKRSEPPTRAEIVWYDPELDPLDYQLALHVRRGTLEEALTTLLPPEKRRRIQQRLAAVLEAHGEEMLEAFRPVVEASLRDSVPVLEEALKGSFVRHREAFRELGERWEEKLVRQRLVPLVKTEVVPSIRTHAQPVAEEIGRELWDRASLWRFGWRAIYDRSPLPKRGLTRSEWERFVNEEAVPVFETHLEEILEAQQQILLDLLQNPAIREELESMLREGVSDPEFQQLMETVVREAVVENERLHAVWTENFRSQEAQAAMRLAGQRLEPVVRAIGDDLLGTQEAGIDPDFARLLRQQILGKDRQWITAIARDGDGGGGPTSTRPADAPLVIRRAAPGGRYPLLLMADAKP